MIDMMDKARQIVEKVGDLPPIPTILLKCLELLNDPTTSIRKIQDQIVLDQAITAFVLKMANSPLYGMRTEVSTITHAINLMGYNTTRSLLLAFFTRNYFQGAGSRMVQNGLWRHAIACAVFGRKIAEKVRSVNSEEAFVASLLHDIGKGVLFTNRTKEYEKAVSTIFNRQEVSIVAEQEIFGFTHIEVGFLVMKKWGFSDKVVEATIFHHHSEEYSGENLLVPLVSMANKLCHLNGFSFIPGQRELSEGGLLGLSVTDLEEIREHAMLEIGRHLEIFG